jgi:hypothetical protein
MNGVLEHLPMTSNPALNAILLGHLRSMDAHFWPGIDGLTLDVVLDSYCQAAAAGHVPGSDELQRCHPDLTDAISALFAGCADTARQESQPVFPPLYFEHTD